MKRLFLVSALLFCVSTAWANPAAMMLQMCDPVVDGDTCSGIYGEDSEVDDSQTSVTQYQATLVKISLSACTGSNPSIYARLEGLVGGATNLIYGIYDDDGGSGEPGTQLYDSGDVIDVPQSTAAAWYGDTSTVADLTGDIWVGLIPDAANTKLTYTVGAGDVRYISLGSYAFPSTWDAAGDSHSTAMRHIYIEF